MTQKRSTLFKTCSMLDRFGSTISFQLEGSSRYKHVLGSLITILTLGAAIGLTSEIFTHFLNYTDPTISAYTEYDLKSIEFNYSDFFFGVTFYNPIQDDSKGFGIRDNNYTTIKFINQLNLTCETCGQENKSTRMNLCAEEQYSGKRIKSVSEVKSNSLIGFFKNYSFCFPEGINGTIEDIDLNKFNSTQDTSLSVFIPISSVSIEELDIKTNNQGVPDASNPTDIVKITTSTVTKPIEPVPSPTQPPQPTTSGTQPTQPILPGSTGTQPIQPTQPGGATGTQPTLPGGATGTQPTQPGGATGTQPTQPGGATGTLPTQPGGATGTQPTQPGGATGKQPTSPTSPTGGTQPTYPSVETQPTSPNSPTTTTTTTPVLSGSPLPARLLQKTISSTLADATINTQMQNILSMFKFPKMLVLNRSFELNPGASNPKDLLKYIYNLEVLDYRDPLSGNPIVYDIYVQKKKIIVIRPENFSTKTEITNVLSIQRIEKNQFDSLQNNGAYFSFKLYSDVEVIKITYVNLTDVLSVFGSFFTTFTLVGSIIASLYQNALLDSGILNSVFKFVDNDPKEFKKIETNFVKMMRENKSKKNIEIEMKQMNQKKEKYKNYRIESVKDEEEKNELSNDNNDDKSFTYKESEVPIFVNEIILKEKDKEFIVTTIDNNNNKNNNFNPAKMLSIPQKEKLSLNKKIKEIEELQEHKIWEGKMSLIEIHELNKFKYQKRNLRRVSSFKMLCIQFGCSSCIDKQKLSIWKSALDIINQNIQIVTLIKRNMDIEELKKTLFSPKQFLLFKNYFKNINYKNPDESIDFLKKFTHKENEEEKIKILGDEDDLLRGKMSRTLYNNFKTKFNF